MSVPPGHESRPDRAAVPAEPPKKGLPGWLVPLVAALVVLALLLLLLTQCGGDDDEDTATVTGPAPVATEPSTTAPPTTTEPETPDPSVTPVVPVVPDVPEPTTTSTPPSTPPSTPSTPDLPQAGPGDVLVTASGVAVLPLTVDGGADLAAVVGQPVTADGVQVESVVTDRGFWVGPSADQRVFVLFDVPGESEVTIEAGQVVDFPGTVVANADDLVDETGLADDEGAALLQEQGVHLVVVPSDLEVVGQAD